MELKPPKARKKSNVDKIIMWGKMFKTPLLILLLLGTTRCDDHESTNSNKISIPNVPNSNSSFKISKPVIHRHRHNHVQPVNDSSMDVRSKAILSDIKYLRKHLNKEVVNFVVTDVLVDGEIENRIHFKGVSAKETYVGADGSGLKLRQLTDGRHFVQLIYNEDGVMQDCEYITKGKQVREFLKTLRSELKQALEEEQYRILQKETRLTENEKFYRHFGNVTFRILKNGEELPEAVALWLNYDKLKIECLSRHDELKRMAERMNKVGVTALARSKRSIREKFILPGTKWCGAGQLAARYNELGGHEDEDRCCRTHDHCRVNIAAFTRRFGYFNLRPYTLSHCRCDRRFRACLKLANTDVSNMVGKLFFNVVQTQCFVLKPVKVCTQRSWWGKCLRKGYRKQAYLRNNLSY